jgi:muramoyltetrapeptide carboxypeptidase
MRVPNLLKPGDQVMILSPASPPSTENWKKGIEILENWGLQVIVAPNSFNQYFGFAGTDEERRSDLQLAINDPHIKAILPLRGGYGSSRILDKIDFSPLLDHPKWIVGFSDITALLMHLDSIGLGSIHGPMPHNYVQENGSLALLKLKELLFEGKTHIELEAHPLNKMGESSGEIFGGNLSLLVHLLGSNSFADPTGKIMIIEEIGERLYHVDRMLLQLKRAGILAKLSGLLVGGFTDCEEAQLKMGKSLEALVLEHTQEYDYPIAFDFSSGHIPDNYPLIFGKKINLLVNNEKVQLTD